MSWQTINKVLSLAIIDEVFADELLKDPREALRTYGIQLPSNELEILCACQAQSLPELSKQLVKNLGQSSL